jgi:hypothetical protein
MRLVHAPEHYYVEPKPEYDVELKGNGFFIGTSTREREPNPFTRLRCSGFVGIDFEHEDVNKWIEAMCEPIKSDRRFLEYKRDLFFPGTLFIGVFPVAYERDNVWKCSFDQDKEIMSHRQHYRYRDFSMFVRRCEYTTYESFKLILSDPNVKHVIVDKLTHECLSNDFETFQDEAKIANTAEKELGLILKIGDRMVFADTFLPTERHWVNENPGSTSARPQFIVVQPEAYKPWSTEVAYAD